MKLSRGLALMLIVFGSLFGGLGLWLAPPHGPPASSFEALRRYETASRLGQISVAASLGIKSLALARADKRWSATELADLEYRVAQAARAAGRPHDALELARSADARLGVVRDVDMTLVINAASTHGDLALAAGETLEAACAYGLLLERLGPDRIAHPELRLRAHPQLEWLTQHLNSIGERFANAAPANTKPAAAWSPTSCNLVADIYAERHDIAAASAVSEAVLAQAKDDKELGPEIRGALLQQAARIAEQGGDVATAKARLSEAIQILDGEDHKAALAVALESFATLLTNWSDAKGALPVLARAIALREAVHGPRHPSLVSPLLALGYAELDTADAASAETTLKHALDIAESEYGRNPGAALEAMLALGELYEDEGRTSEASALHAKTDRLRGSGVALRPSDVEDVPIEVPSAKSRLAVFEIAFRTSAPARVGAGHVEVALAAPRSAPWAKSWDDETFVPASETFAHPLVYAPKSEAAGAADAPSRATLIFIPGQGTGLAGNAARLARLQALLGPSEVPVLVDWTSEAASGAGLRDRAAEAAGQIELQSLIATIVASKQSSPLTLIAEGRGAELLAAALEQSSEQQRQAINGRLARLVLIAPDLESDAFDGLLSRIDKPHVHTVVYAARTALPLLVAQEVYGATPIGLDPAQLSKIEGIETIEIGIGSDWASFDGLSSNALIADIANVVRGGPPAAKRCGLTHMLGADTGDVFVLNPKGCTAPTTN